MKIKQISPLESPFLAKLYAIALKPKILYYYGKLPEVDQNTGKLPKIVSIVGSRKMTPYGEEYAYKIAYELAKRGVVIVSGLAIGLDSVAHRGALDAGGITVAILGTPIDKIYPAQHQRLADEIIEKGGAIISECPPFSKSVIDDLRRRGVSIDGKELGTWKDLFASKNGARSAFPRRNRLVAGLSDVIVVAEADLKSGSLNTAMHGLEQGRTVFAVPGDVSRQMSKGCNSLFGKGALAFTCIEDILSELYMLDGKSVRKQVPLFGDTPEETAILKALEGGINDGEEILQWIRGNNSGCSNMSVAVFNQNITMLEIKGVIKRMYGNQWLLI